VLRQLSLYHSQVSLHSGKQLTCVQIYDNSFVDLHKVDPILMSIIFVGDKMGWASLNRNLHVEHKNYVSKGRTRGGVVEPSHDVLVSMWCSGLDAR